MSAAIVGLIGIWMIVSAFVSMAAIGHSWNEWIAGIVVFVLGLAMSRDHGWQRVLAMVVGVWLFISGFIPAFRLGGALVTNDVVMGVLLIIAGFTAVSSRRVGTTPPRVAP